MVAVMTEESAEQTITRLQTELSVLRKTVEDFEFAAEFAEDDAEDDRIERVLYWMEGLAFGRVESEALLLRELVQCIRTDDLRERVGGGSWPR